RSLGTRFMVRLHAMAMMAGAIAAGWLAEWILLKQGLEGMGIRYPASIFVAYVAVFVGAQVWIDRSRILKYLNATGAQELLGSEVQATGRVAATRRGEQGDSSGGWDLLWFFPDVLAWLLFALAAISLAVMLLYGVGFYIIAEAEWFFAEIVFELL